MERVIKIWEERKLFEKEYFEVLCNKLGKFIYCWIVIKYLEYLIIFNMLMNVFICFNYINDSKVWFERYKIWSVFVC